jgi:hypothetical protein
MLYHLPDPERGLAELARVCRLDGVVMAATSGAAHLRELWEIRAAVFGGPPGSATVDMFGTESGEPMLRHHFDQVEWRLYEDELHCTRADDVVAFITSSPPGEDATLEQHQHLLSVVEERLERGRGLLRVSKGTGVFLARRPKP